MAAIEAVLEQSEGFKAKPYPDGCHHKLRKGQKCRAPKYSIGFGSQFYEDDRRVAKNDPAITRERGKQIKRAHIRQRVAPRYKGVRLTLNERTAAYSFTYNTGRVALKNGRFSEHKIAGGPVGFNGEYSAALEQRRLMELTLALTKD